MINSSMGLNGTLTQWRVGFLGPEKQIFFPEKHLRINGERKLRGGAPVCCPNFGPDKHNRGLPQHGLVRTSRGLVTIDGSTFVYEKDFKDPFPHNVRITADFLNDARMLSHEIRVLRKEERAEFEPLSIGFHPYFATEGTGFELRSPDEFILDDSSIEVGKALYLDAEKIGDCLLLVIQGDIVIRITIGYRFDNYDGFYVWTDNPDKYICIEPVMGTQKFDRGCIAAKEIITCSCTIEVL